MSLIMFVEITMKKITIILFLLIGISSCTNGHKGEKKLSPFVSITDNEDVGVKEILDYYGGYCKYSVGRESETEIGKSTNTTKYFKLEMSKSDVLEEYSQKIGLPASNMAYLFYKNLKDEKSNYNEIRTSIILKDGKEREFKFPVEQLEMVNKKMLLVNKIVNLLKEKKYEEIKPLLNDKGVVKYDKEELFVNILKVEPALGDIETFLPFGFYFQKLDGGGEVLHISGMIKRNKQNNEFSINLDPSLDKDEVYSIDYKL